MRTIIRKSGVSIGGLVLSILLVGCSGTVQMMPRDSGKVYSGRLEGSGFGKATMTIAIAGVTYTGPVVQTSSSDSFGLIQTYGSQGTNTGTVAMSGGSHRVKGILSSADGHGLRCEFESTGSSGGGICQDDAGHVYDAIVTR